MALDETLMVDYSDDFNSRCVIQLQSHHAHDSSHWSESIDISNADGTVVSVHEHVRGHVCVGRSQALRACYCQH